MQFTTRKQAHEFYADIMSDAKKKEQEKAVMAMLGRKDLFFLLIRLLNRHDIDQDWLFERCKEVQISPNGHLDLWAREHYKSTIITFGLTIQDVLNDPEVTIGIFSITRPNAKKFLWQIREEFTKNDVLKHLYSEILWEDPEKQASKWSLDEGIIVKRKQNPKEGTIEAHGLVRGMPTGRHFKIRIYDDVIDEENVTNPEMIKLATQQWELSLNLGSTQKTKMYDEVDIERYIGTRYHLNDPYNEIMKRGAAISRIHPGTDNGKTDGNPVFWSKELMAKKRRKMGPYIFACQILQDPKADDKQGFDKEWLKYWGVTKTNNLNIYIVCDPASEKKTSSDYTVFWVIGLGPDENYYLIDGIRDRLSLTERAKTLFQLHRTYKPLEVGYEKYGMQADTEHFADKMERENYRFNITELGGNIPKPDRIKKLVPIFEQGRMYIPRALHKADYEGKTQNLIDVFVDEEYTMFPVASHDDMLDAMARILDPKLDANFPENNGNREEQQTHADNDYNYFRSAA